MCPPNAGVAHFHINTWTTPCEHNLRRVFHGGQGSSFPVLAVAVMTQQQADVNGHTADSIQVVVLWCVSLGSPHLTFTLQLRVRVPGSAKRLADAPTMSPRRVRPQRGGLHVLFHDTAGAEQRCVLVSLLVGWIDLLQALAASLHVRGVPQQRVYLFRGRSNRHLGLARAEQGHQVMWCDFLRSPSMDSRFWIRVAAKNQKSRLPYSVNLGNDQF